MSKCIQIIICAFCVLFFMTACFFPGTGGRQQTVFKAGAVYSPDGSKIAFISNIGGDLEIYFMNIDGTNPVQLTDNTFGDIDVRWSPDGSRLLFASDRSGEWEIYVMGTDGSNVEMIPTPLTTGEN